MAYSNRWYYMGLLYRLGLGLGLVFLVSALNKLQVSSVGVEVLVSAGILCLSSGQISDQYW